ncbi:MAG TPA: hypothetical protein VGE76_06995 [Opitutaceae bacterium]
MGTYFIRFCALPVSLILSACASRYQSGDTDLLWVHTTAPVSHQLSSLRVFEREGRLHVQFAKSGQTAVTTAAEETELRQRIANIQLRQVDIDAVAAREKQATDAPSLARLARGMISPEYRIEIVEARGTRELVITNPARFDSPESADETTTQVRQLLELVRKLTDRGAR